MFENYDSDSVSCVETDDESSWSKNDLMESKTRKIAHNEGLFQVDENDGRHYHPGDRMVSIYTSNTRFILRLSNAQTTLCIGHQR